jgi:ubiquinone/menaquinone biosynthesis C-methylase UbiE
VSKRTFKEDKLAKLYDAEVVPIWSRRFGRMLMRDLTVPGKAMVLDVNCGSGYPSLDILRKMDEQGRIIAIDTSSPLLDEARSKAGKLSGKRIFFRSESTLPKLSFAEEVYDLVLSNAGLQQLDDPEPAVRECARVTKLGGRVIATYPLAGTFGEFHDLFREVLVKGDYKDAIDRLDAYLTRYPPLEQAAGWFEDAGLTDIETEFESFTLLFKSSREFFFAPIIEYGPLSTWKAIAGKGQQMQDVFWQTKAAIDAYFHGSAFSVTVNAGCVRGRKVAREPVVQVTGEEAGVQKGARASSNPRQGSRPSSAVEPPAEPELPDAPSDEVDALSGSWPVPEPELVREHTGTGSSEPKWEISGLSDYADEIPTLSRERQATPASPEEADEDPPGDPDEELQTPPQPTRLPEARGPRAETGTVQLGTGEIELVEGSAESTAGVRPAARVVRRDDDPDDPDIL